MIEAPTPCHAYIALETLSAWRDRALSAGEHRRLTEHVAACAACQYRLRALDTIGHLLQLRDSDDYQEQIWQRLQAKLHRPATPRLAIAPRLIAAISVLIIIALFVLVTYQRGVLHQGHSLATATAVPPTMPTTPTTVPVSTPITVAQSPLQWQPTAPRAWNVAGDGNTLWFAPAPSDGTQVYACAQLPGTTAVQIWKTSNRGARWLSLGTISSVTNGTCGLTIDQHNPNLVILNITRNAQSTPTFSNSYISHDGGKTWQEFLQGEYFLEELQAGSTSYAALSDASSNELPYMAMSRDGFKTWQKIMPSQVMPYDFWVSSSGELLLASDPNKMWLTDDQGQTWRSIPVPYMLADTSAYQQTGTTDWGICGKVQSTRLDCSYDNGQTWHSYLAPGPVDDAQLLGVAADNTLIVDLFANASSPQQRLYRFAPQAGQWQLLGSTPDASVTFSHAPNGAGILWAWYTASPGDDAQQRNFTALLP